jgi:H+/gluconate symporter-like permease
VVEQCGTDQPMAAPFFIILVVVAAVLVLTAKKLHAALLLPLVAVVAGLAGAIGHDWDATFLGLTGGLCFAIPLADCGRRKQDP